MITYTDWLKRTAVLASRRSPLLQQVDGALKIYSTPGGATSANLVTLKKAFEAWKQSKGAAWKQSDRNKGKACEQLDAELKASSQPIKLSKEELDAMKFIEEHNKQNLAKMFRGRQLTWKLIDKVRDAKEVISSLNDFRGQVESVAGFSSTDAAKGLAARAVPVAAAAVKTGATFVQTTLAKAKELVHELLKSLFDAIDLHTVMEALGHVFHQVVAAVTPYVGMAVGAAKAVKGWADAAKQLYKRHKIEQTREVFAKGDPAAAFDSIVRLLTRDLLNTVRDAATESVATLTQTAFTIADYGAISGPAIGAAKAFANLVAQIYRFARDYLEMKRANKALAQGKLDLSLFEINPLLGCYLVACSDTSAVISMAVTEYGRPGWMFEAEDMVRRAQPVLEKAKEYIQGSRFHIRELEHSKGMTKAKESTKTKLLGVAGKVRSLVFDQIEDAIA